MLIDACFKERFAHHLKAKSALSFMNVCIYSIVVYYFTQPHFVVKRNSWIFAYANEG